MAPPRQLRLASGIGFVLAGVAALSGARRLSDSSFFTHLATGRIIWDSGFPRSDPYTFTAAGEPWVVQSWLASALYAGVERTVGLEWLRVLLGAIAVLVVVTTWLLTRAAGTVSARLLSAVPAAMVLCTGWSERPLVLGLACLGGYLLAAEGTIDARWLVPITWIWVNTHGSWPLGPVVLAALLAGAWLDKAGGTTELRAARWALVGLALAVVNPYGVDLLTFPLELLTDRRDSLAELREWRPPTFSRASEQLFIAVAVIAVAATARRWSWRAALPTALFVLAAATGARNVLPAALVLVPATASGLAGWGSVAAGRTGPLGTRLAAIGVALAAVGLGNGLRGEPLDERPYPRGADAWLRSNGLDPSEHRVIAREVVGNWWELVYGPTGNVFVDDRVEVLPYEVVVDHGVLLDGSPGWEEVLAEHRADAVLWEADQPLARLLERHPMWRIGYEDDRFIVAVRAREASAVPGA